MKFKLLPARWFCKNRSSHSAAVWFSTQSPDWYSHYRHSQSLQNPRYWPYHQHHLHSKCQPAIKRGLMLWNNLQSVAYQVWATRNQRNSQHPWHPYFRSQQARGTGVIQTKWRHTDPQDKVFWQPTQLPATRSTYGPHCGTGKLTWPRSQTGRQPGRRTLCCLHAPYCRETHYYTFLLHKRQYTFGDAHLTPGIR